MNPCKCGHLADPNLACSKAPRCGLDYQARLSGPILDRIDLQVEVPAVPVAELTRASDGEPSAVVAARVATAHAVQQERYQDDGITSNAEADGDVLARHTALTADGQKLLEEVAQKFRLSARGYTRVLRVARTLADLEGAATISRLHLAEAIGYRRFSMARVSAAA
jgi:magnesium chelatase family protein